MLSPGKKENPFLNNMKKSIYILSAIAFLASCSKLEVPVTSPVVGEPICFSIPQELGTKAPVYTDAQLTVANSEVRIYGTQGGTVMEHYNNTPLSYNSVTGLWTPATSDVWAHNGENGYNYSFWAYGFNKVNGDVSPTITTSGDNFGKRITLVEPETYAHQDGGFGYDYLLSERFDATSYKVVNGGNTVWRGPVVRLHMEHALALIEVRMKIHKDIYQAILQGVELKGFYRGATMECTYHATYGNSIGATNRWSVNSYSNSGASYSRGSIEEGDGNTTELYTFEPDRGDGANEIQLMLFTAIPQTPSTAQLKVVMKVQEVAGAPVHQVISTWNLNEYYNWEYGYRNVYTINIDTSNKLDATIDDWPVVNNVSGTILPKID